MSADEDRWTEIVSKFADGQTIDEDEARFIASQWHGGQNSALYAFASSGTILPELIDEITTELPWDSIEVKALYSYVKAKSPSHRFEFQIGLYVDAENEQEAMEKISKLIDMANELDAEEDAAVEMVGKEDI